MGIALDLAVLLAIAVLGQSTFAVFEVETPAYALRATPRRRYYELRGWAWQD
jgi:hypothetical protein